MPATSPGLSDVFVKKLKSNSPQKRFSDGGGLFIQLSPNGTNFGVWPVESGAYQGQLL